MEIKIFDIIFYFDATILKDFGHGARCLKIARILLKNNNNLRLCFEALAHGAPLCVLGQKSFQLEYSKLLEDKKVALSIGKPIEQKSDYLIYKIHELIKNNNTFSKNAFFFVKPGGLARISDIILSNYE